MGDSKAQVSMRSYLFMEGSTAFLNRDASTIHSNIGPTSDPAMPQSRARVIMPHFASANPKAIAQEPRANEGIARVEVRPLKVVLRSQRSI